MYFVSYSVDVYQCACQDEEDKNTVADFKIRMAKLKVQRDLFLAKKAVEKRAGAEFVYSTMAVRLSMREVNCQHCLHRWAWYVSVCYVSFKFFLYC